MADALNPLSGPDNENEIERRKRLGLPPLFAREDGPQLAVTTGAANDLGVSNTPNPMKADPLPKDEKPAVAPGQQETEEERKKRLFGAGGGLGTKASKSMSVLQLFGDLYD